MEYGQSSSESLQNSYQLKSVTIKIEEARYSPLSEQTNFLTCSNESHDYHINNKRSEDPQTYIAMYVHNKQLYLFFTFSPCIFLQSSQSPTNALDLSCSTYKTYNYVKYIKI
jgi:hypothetical protein